MDPGTIILGVLLVLVIVYMIFQSYFSGKTALTNQIRYDSNPPEIDSSKIAAPDALRFSYTIWVYVNNWNTSVEKLIFKRDNEIKLYLDETQSKLVCIVGNPLDNPSSKIIVTNNFPIQKWVCITLSLDEKIVDLYLDGKLVKSVQTNGLNNTANPYVNEPIKFTGEGSWDGTFSKFERRPDVTDPHGAWEKYMEGNGGSTLSRALGNYNVNLSILKDNVATSQFTLF